MNIGWKLNPAIKIENSVGMSKVVGLILSGGAGSRLGGINKGLVEVQGRPLVQWVYDALFPQVDTIYISANHDLERYKAVTTNVVLDDSRFYREGPLAGIYALAPYVNDDDIVQVVTCDLPLLPKDLVEKLLNRLHENDLEAIYPEDDHHRHYGLLMFRAQCIKKLEALLLGKQLRIRDFLAVMRHESLRFDDSTDFINGNDWESVELITKILEERQC